MDLRISSAARSRAFSKAMRRLRTSHQQVLDDVRSVELENPTWSTLYLTFTDELPPGSMNEMGAKDGMLQLFAGFPSVTGWTPDSDHRIREIAISIIHEAIARCELTPADRNRIDAVIN